MWPEIWPVLYAAEAEDMFDINPGCRYLGWNLAVVGALYLSHIEGMRMGIEAARAHLA